MRFTPPVLALSLLVAVSASAGSAASPQPLDPRARALLADGRAALAGGQLDAATDAFEAALVIQPGNATVLVDLAEATRRQGMQGKALHYYRDALEADPHNLAALSGEGSALAEKGALEKARRDLARLEGLCGGGCDATRGLAAAIARGPVARVAAATPNTPAPKLSAE